MIPLRRDVVTSTAVRGPLRRTVRLVGFLESADNVVVRSGCQWPVQLVEIVPEGTYVEAGEVVARLNTAGIWPHEQRTRIDMLKIQKWAAGAKERLHMQTLINAGLVARAKLTLELAELDLEAFREGQMPRDRNARAGAVEMAREAVVRGQERLSHSKRMARKGYASATDVEDERLSLRRSRHQLTTAEGKYRVLTGFTQNRTLTALEAAVGTAREELARVKSVCEIRQRTKQIDHLAAEKTLLKQEGYLRMFDEANAGCELKAPRAGRVVHARGLKVHGGRPPEPGDWIHLRQAVVELPRFDTLQVRVRIPESKVRNVGTGLAAEVRVDARPLDLFGGRVSEVATLPTAENSPNEDRRSYEAVVSLDASAAEALELQPGLTAAVNVVSGERADCVQVPPQSVVAAGDRWVVFVRVPGGLEVRDVVLGLRSVTAVEVVSGLSEWERVVLSPRRFLTEEILNLRSEG